MVESCRRRSRSVQFNIIRKETEKERAYVDMCIFYCLFVVVVVVVVVVCLIFLFLLFLSIMHQVTVSLHSKPHR